MNDILSQKIKKDLKKIDKLGAQLGGCSRDDTIESVKSWWQIKNLAREYENVDCSMLQTLINIPETAARAIFFIEVIRNISSEECLPYLEYCLDHENTLIGEDACYALALQSASNVKEILSRKLNRTKDKYLREAIARTLSNYDQDEVPDYVLKYYQNPEKRSDAIDMLKNVCTIKANDMLIDAWLENDRGASSRAYQALHEQKRGTVHVRRRLRDIAGSKKASLQLDAIRLLGVYRDEDSVALFRSMYPGSSIKARQQILLGLGKIGTAEASDLLMSLMNKEVIPEVFAYGCMGLGTCEFPEAVDYLMSVIEEARFGSGEIKPVGMGLGDGLYEIAAGAIKRNPISQAIPHMIALLEYDNPRVREEMAKGLATRKAVEAIEALERAIIREEDSEIRDKLEASHKKLNKYK